MGRIKTFVLLGAALSTVLMLSGCGNTLLADVESRVSAAKSITIDFHYDGPYELSSNYPIYLRIFPNPVDTRISQDDLKTDIKLEKNNTVAVQVSSLYPSESGKYFAFIIHDLNNNGIDSEDDSDDFMFVNDGINNCGEIPEDDIIVDGNFHTFPDANLMSVGEKYAINFNLEKDTNDVFEPDNSYNIATIDELTDGQTSQEHQLGWDDVDYIKLFPANSSSYKVTIDRYNSTIPIDIEIFSQDQGLVGSEYGITEADMPLTIPDLDLTASNYYYLRVGYSDGFNNAMRIYTASFVMN